MKTTLHSTPPRTPAPIRNRWISGLILLSSLFLPRVCADNTTLTWNGATGSVWDTAAANWTNTATPPAARAAYASGDRIIINNATASPLSIDIQPAGVTVADLAIDAARAGITLAGGGITADTIETDLADATGKLVKTGAAALDLTGITGANTFHGGVRVAEGTLVIRTAAQLGTTLASLDLGSDSLTAAPATLDITGNLTITAAASDTAQRLRIGWNGSELTARNARIRVADGKLLTFSGATFDNTSSPGLYIGSASQLALNNALFENYSTTYSFGVIDLRGRATLENVTFRNNHSDSIAGAINVGYGASGTLAVTSGSFIGNTSGGYAGALNIYQSTAVATLRDTLFSGNAATGDAGAIHNWGTVNLIDTELTGNTAGVSGGALFTDRSATITGGAFRANTASGIGGAIVFTDIHSNAAIRHSLDITGAAFDANRLIDATHDSAGGAISTFGHTAIRDTLFSDNKITDADDGIAGYGGALHLTLTGTLAGRSVLVESSTFTGNLALDGGAIHAAQNYDTHYARDDAPLDITLRDTVFTGNAAIGGGGGGAISLMGNGTLAITVSDGKHLASTDNTARPGPGASDAHLGGFLFLHSMGATGQAVVFDTGDNATHTIGRATTDASYDSASDSIASSTTDARIVKTGRGALILNADNSGYIGATRVAAGTLIVNHTHGGIDTTNTGTHTLAVATGGTLGGAGRVGGLATIETGGVIDTAHGALAFDTLALADGALIRHSADANSGLGHALVTGILSLAGTGDIALYGNNPAGTYEVLSYAALAAGSVSPADYFAANANINVTTAGKIIHTLGDASNFRYWTGGDGTWNATATNWYPNTNYTPAEAAAWLAGGLAIFERAGDPGGAVTVNDNMVLSGLQFDATGYTLAGAGALVGDSGSFYVNTKANVTAAIATAIRTGALQKYGDGSLTLSGGITATGDFNLSLNDTGTLALSGNTTATSGGAIYADGFDSIAIGGNHGFLGVTSNTATVNGGAIRTQHGDVTITATTGDFYIEENHAGTYGGAITANGDIIISGSTGGVLAISGNTAGLAGGALYSGTGDIRVTGDHSDISITGNAISDPEGLGGGAFEAAKGGIIIDADTAGALTIATNLGRYRGGAFNAAGSVHIGGTHFTITIASNTSTYAAQRNAVGGAIFSGSDITISATTAGPFVIVTNYADLRGGALNAAAGSILVEGEYDGDISIGHNTAAGANAIGGAFYARDGITLDTRSVTASISGNYSGTDGGAFATAAGDISIGGHASNLVITNNRSQYGSGGAFYARTGGIAITTALTSGAIFITGNNAALSGGALYAAGNILIDATTDIAPLLITGNTAATTGDLVRGGAFYSGSNITITGSYAGGMTITGNAADATHDPDGHAFGGAFYANRGITINATTTDALEISANTAIGTAVGQGGAFYSGGDIALGGTHSAILINTNTAGSHGGAFYADDGITISATTTGTLEISGNAAVEDSGGAFAAWSYILLNGNHSDILIDSNTTLGAGGAFFTVGNITISATTTGTLEISGNSAGEGSGGAFFAWDDILLNGSHSVILIKSNTAFYSGGALHAGGDITITGSHNSLVIEKNSAESTAANGIAQGGALFAGGSAMIGGTYASIIITSNTASGPASGTAFGGAVYSGGDVIISATTAGALLVNRNYSSRDGGVAYAGGGISITGNYTGGISILENIAANGAGGIFYARDGISITATSASGPLTIGSNYAGLDGGAFYAVSGDIRILGQNASLEITGNQAAQGSGGAFFARDGDIGINTTVSNGAYVIAGNRAALSGGAFYSAGGIHLNGSTATGPLAIAANTASTTEGYARGGAFYSGGNITISGSYARGITIANNSAISTDDFSSGQGGAFYAGGDITVNASSSGTLAIRDNIADDPMFGSGGAFYSRGNITIGGDHNGILIASNTSMGTGGAFDARYDITISATTANALEITGNRTHGAGAALYSGLSGGILLNGKHSAILVNSNTANYAGGAFYAKSGITIGATTAGALEIAGNLARADASSVSGGAFYGGSGDITLDGRHAGGILIASNTALSTASGGRANGGAFHTSLNILLGGDHGAISIIANNTQDAGGAFYANRDITISATTAGAIEISGNSAASNHASLKGGAFYSGSSITVGGDYAYGIFIAGNTASTTHATGAASGGALHAHDGDILINAKTSGTLEIRDNTAFGNDYAAGGALYSGGGITLEGVSDSIVIKGNTAIATVHTEMINGLGGAFYSESNILISATTGMLEISHNTASYNGGAFYSTGGITLTGSHASILITSNTSRVFGGAFSTLAGDIRIDATLAGALEISGNSALGANGGAFFTSSGDILLNAKTGGALNISGNSAGWGGALATVYGTIALTGNHASIIIASNTATEQGGAFLAYLGDILIETKSARALQISNNTATSRGGALFAGGDITINAGSGSELAIHANNSGTSGGAFASADGDIAISGLWKNISVTSNRAANGSGGAFHTGAGDIRITSAVTSGMLGIAGNQAATSGGALHAGGDIVIDATGPDTQLVILANTAAGGDALVRGGAFYSGGAITLSGSYADGMLVSGNAASTTHATGAALGGAFYAGNGFTLNLAENTTFTAEGNFAQTNASGGFLYVETGGIIFNIGQSATATIGNATSAANAADSIATASSNVLLTKSGAGALILNSDNAHYTGTTAVNAGSLILGATKPDGSPITAASLGGHIRVNAAATLAGAGSAASITVHSGGTLAPAPGSALQPFSPSALRVSGTLTLHGGANLNYNLFSGNTTSTITADTLVLANASAANQINIRANTAITGTYVLVDAAQTIAAFGDDWFNTSFGDGTGSTLVATYTRDTAANDLILTLALDENLNNLPLTWTGSANTTWDATAANWSGRTTGQFAPGDRVTVGTSLATPAPVLIDIIAGGVQVADIRVTGDQNVTLAGGRIITGTTPAHTTLADATGKLVKTGAGTLDLTGIIGENDFTGGVTLGGGALRVSSTAQLGATMDKFVFTATETAARLVLANPNGSGGPAHTHTIDGDGGMTQRLAGGSSLIAIELENGVSLEWKNSVGSGYRDGAAIHAGSADGPALLRLAALDGDIRFTNNHGDYYGGALAVYAAYIDNPLNTAALEIATASGNIDFTNNSAAWDGGAFDVSANAEGRVTISSLTGAITFRGNKTQLRGGALSTNIVGGPSLITLTAGAGGILFENNEAELWGGAIYVKSWVSSTTTLHAKAGDITFNGNLHDVDFDNRVEHPGTPNAIYIHREDDDAPNTLNLVAETGQTIAFFDPVETACESQRFNGVETETFVPTSTLTVAINRNPDTLAATTGTVRFDTRASEIHRAHTTVYDGTLILSGGAHYGSAETIGSAFTLNAPARLVANAGNNTLAADRIDLRGTIDLADTARATGTLTLAGDVILHGGATLRLDLGASNTSDRIAAGTLDFAGITASDKITLDLLPLISGSFTLITSATTTNFAETNFTIADTGGLAAQITLGSNAADIVLALASDRPNTALHWTGATGTAIWNATLANWTDNAATPATTFAPGDRVTVGASLATPSTDSPIAIDIHAPGVGVADIHITGTRDIILTGGGIQTGTSTGFTTLADATGKLTKTGAATLALANAANTFTNGIDLAEGAITGNTDTLRVGAGAAITLAADTTLIYNLTATGTATTTHTGAGGIIKRGAGSLTLAGANTATGNFTHETGAVHLATTWAGDYTLASTAGALTHASTASIAGNLTATGATLIHDLAAPALAIGGEAAFTGTNTIDLAAWQNGAHTLYTTGGGITGLANISDAITINGETPNARQTATLALGNSGNDLLLTLASGANVALAWTGSANATWNTTAANWTDSANPAVTQFLDGDAVTFGSGGMGDSPMSVPSSIRVAGMTITGGTHAFTGAAIISTSTTTLENPAQKLTLAANASATFSNTLSFANGIDISPAATLTLTDGADLAGTGALQNNGTFIFDFHAAPFTLRTSISGTGTVSNRGQLRSLDTAVRISGPIVNTGHLALASGTCHNTLANSGTVTALRHALGNVTNTGLITTAPGGATFAQNLAGVNGVIRYRNLGERITIAGNLSGSQTLVNVEVNLATDQADTLAVLGAASGTHTLRLVRAGNTGPADPETFSLPIVTIATGDATFTSPDTIADGMNIYGLAQASPVQWNLTRIGQSQAASVILSTAAILGADWHYSLDALHNRLGDLISTTLNAKRQTPNSGAKPAGNVWLRTHAYRLNAAPALAGDTFRQHTYAVTAGADRNLSRPDSATTLLAGGFLQMSRSNRDYDHHGESSTSAVALGLYATAIHETGWYADLAFKLDNYDNTLDARETDRAPVTATYASRAAGLSLELGKRITRKPSSSTLNLNLWIEPSIQAAVAFLDSAAYATSTNIDVTLGSSTAWQTRAQLRAGATLARWMPYIKIAETRSDTRGGALRAQGRVRTPDYDGWRFETGAGVSYLIDPQNQLYLDYEYNKSPACERPWSLNLGYRRVW